METRSDHDGRRVSADPNWWRGAVIYQIYPRSFQDSGGDGVGDLRGIAERLSHVARLGADAVWISPFFTSPMKDFGYDVADYRNVDPLFGTLGDFDRLVDDAHDLALRVMIDLVLSHTSDQHPWFRDSRQSRTNAKSDWYVWADPREDGTPPNNWLSVFGGSSWEWDASRRQYYLHNFLASQPDLNFHNPAVQDALLGEMRFWLERGVDGFRLDAVNFYFHDPNLTDNPPLAPERRRALKTPGMNPYVYQDHLHDKDRPENLDFLKRLRSVLDEYPDRAAVGEVGDGPYSLELVSRYASGGDKLHMCYGFDFLTPDPLTPEMIAGVLERFDREASDGWPCWAFSNHDVPRHFSRWCASAENPDAFARLAMAVLLSLRGSVCLYQGEELGLPESDIALRDIRDPYGLRFWPEFKGRDGCRTPMAWRAADPQGGFTSGGSPWLPVDSGHLSRAVDLQEADPTSLLSSYRRMIDFRKRHAALRDGSQRICVAEDGLLAFVRGATGDEILCLFNLTGVRRQVARPEFAAFEPLEGHVFAGRRNGTAIELRPFDAFFGRKSK